ncbi:FAD-dependent monooxygenase [Amphibiibacter pelophylacis]|uniref:FAD-dependent monooxygenase n=1 Tax=Amphibiibacter pelophylacis TaxID=1799477 RepID=A0ACC6P4I7_9BURK
MNTSIHIRGDGAAGLALALSLAHQGLASRVIAGPTDTAASDLRAWALNGASKELLAALNVWDQLPAAAVTPIQAMRVQGDQGGVLEFSAWQAKQPALGWIVDAAPLLDMLRQAARFAPLVTLAPFEEAPAAAPGLTVLCEGRDSPTRERGHRAAGHGLFSLRQHPYGHSALAGHVHSALANGGQAWQWFRHGEVLALLPRDGGYGLVWSLPHERAAALQQQGPQAIAQALNEATGGLAGELSMTATAALWPLRLAHDSALYGAFAPGSSWVLAGDAAHAIHPLAGQGLNLGLADVRVLAEVLAQARKDSPWRGSDDLSVLARYARQRHGPVTRMARTCDALWQAFAQPHPLAAPLRNLGLDAVNALTPLKTWLVRQALQG